MYPTEESYEPGDEVEAVGYIGASVPIETDKYVARLSMTPDSTEFDNTTSGRAGWHDLGPVTIEPTGLGGYLSTRVSIGFTLPAGMEPGDYFAVVTDAAGNYFSALIGFGVRVGLGPPDDFPRWIEWALDEPLIAELADEAVIAGPGFDVTVAELRAGRYPAGASQFMMNPEILQQPGIVTTTSTSTTSTSTTTTTTIATTSTLAPVSTSPPTIVAAPTITTLPAEARGGMGAVLVGSIVLVVTVAALSGVASHRRRRPDAVEAGEAEVEELVRT